MLKALLVYKKEVNGFIHSYVGWRNSHPDSTFLDITDKNLMMYFLYNHAVQNDMMWRTVRKLKTGTKNVSIDKNEKKAITQKLCDKIMDYILHGTDKTFDEWHSEVCNWFLSEINNKLLAGKYHPFAYGKAQKAVNMTFKYLSTCDNADEYAERFQYCHMPLDSYILEWYYSEVKKNIRKSHRKTWSNLSENEYFEIQNDIRAYLAQIGKIPFVEEWTIWNTYRQV